MIKFLKKVGMWCVLTFQSLMFRLSMSLKNVEEDVLKADADDLDTKKKQEQKIKHRNPLAQKMVVGQRDEQFVKDYYEILKKADAFMKNSTPSQIQVASEKWGMNYGKTDNEINNVTRKQESKPKKDRWGRRYEHFGFFDPKSKNYGKTLAEVLTLETDERKTSDDDYKVELMFSNKPIEQGFAGTDLVEIKFVKTNDNNIEGLEKIVQKKFPLNIVRKKDSLNKIEELTEFVHIKRVSEEYKLIEFFIPAKFKVFDHSEDSEIFKELIDFNQVWIFDEWKKPYGYRVNKYEKKLVLNNKAGDETYHIIKISAYKIDNLN